MSRRKVVVKRDEFVPAAPMEIRPVVKDWKLIYPDTGVPSRTLIMGIVEIAPGQRSPLPVICSSACFRSGRRRAHTRSWSKPEPSGIECG